MLFLRVSRARRGPDRFLPHKILLFVTGAACAFAGIASGREWLINVGIAVLFVGVLLRLIRARSP
jgi:hypothetical protein